MPVATQIAIATAAVAAMMLVLWLIHLRTGNASIVDPGWAGGLALIASIYAFTAQGHPARVWLLAGMVIVWGVRLSMYLLLTRVLGHPEEGRYQEIRRNWKTNIPIKFLAFFEFQALLCVFLSIPFLTSMRNPAPDIRFLEWLGVLVWMISFGGELVADAQLHSFKSDPANKGKTCRKGLWKYSRHPNYFFEWLVWVAFALYATPSEYGYLSWMCPALMLYFLFRVTGIPATEAQALRTKGEDYRQYQQTTSAFVPWFPREADKGAQREAHAR
jgi:steroid 5-alpha reductase family enzyme